MSIKVYTAFRVPTRHLNSVVIQLQHDVLPWAITEAGVTEQTTAEAWANQVDRFQSSDTPFVTKVDLSLRMYHRGNHSYLIPSHDLVRWQLAKEKGLCQLKRYSRWDLVDYSYWNNTDRPDEVPVREWRRRRTVWWELFYGRKDLPKPCNGEAPSFRVVLFSTLSWDFVQARFAFRDVAENKQGSGFAHPWAFQ